MIIIIDKAAFDKARKVYSSREDDGEWRVYSSFRLGELKVVIYGDDIAVGKKYAPIFRHGRKGKKIILAPIEIPGEEITLSTLCQRVAAMTHVTKCVEGHSAWEAGPCRTCEYVKARLLKGDRGVKKIYGKPDIPIRSAWPLMPSRQKGPWVWPEDSLEAEETWLSEAVPEAVIWPRYSFKGGSFIIDPFRMEGYGVREIYVLGGMEVETYEPFKFSRKRFERLEKNIHVDWMSDMDREAARKLCCS